MGETIREIKTVNDAQNIILEKVDHYLFISSASSGEELAPFSAEDKGLIYKDVKATLEVIGENHPDTLMSLANQINGLENTVPRYKNIVRNKYGIISERQARAKNSKAEFTIAGLIIDVITQNVISIEQINNSLPTKIDLHLSDEGIEAVAEFIESLNITQSKCKRVATLRENHSKPTSEFMIALDSIFAALNIDPANLDDHLKHVIGVLEEALRIKENITQQDEFVRIVDEGGDPEESNIKANSMIVEYFPQIA